MEFLPRNTPARSWMRFNDSGLAQFPKPTFGCSSACYSFAKADLTVIGSAMFSALSRPTRQLSSISPNVLQSSRLICRICNGRQSRTLFPSSELCHAKLGLPPETDRKQLWRLLKFK